MKDALFGFTRRVELARVSKASVDHEVVETKADVKWFSAVLQPLSPQKLQVKPEGQRQWKFWDAWSTESLINDDIVKDRCQKEYRVMSRQDWSEAGYYFYELVEKPQ